MAGTLEAGGARQGVVNSYLGVIVGAMAVLAAAVKAAPAAAVATGAVARAVAGPGAERSRCWSGPGRAAERLRRALALVLQQRRHQLGGHVERVALSAGRHGTQLREYIGPATTWPAASPSAATHAYIQRDRPGPGWGTRVPTERDAAKRPQPQGRRHLSRESPVGRAAGDIAPPQPCDRIGPRTPGTRGHRDRSGGGAQCAAALGHPTIVGRRSASRGMWGQSAPAGESPSAAEARDTSTEADQSSDTVGERPPTN